MSTSLRTPVRTYEDTLEVCIPAGMTKSILECKSVIKRKHCAATEVKTPEAIQSQAQQRCPSPCTRKLNTHGVWSILDTSIIVKVRYTTVENASQLPTPRSFKQLHGHNDAKKALHNMDRDQCCWNHTV